MATLRALFSADWAGESLYSVKMDPDIVVCPVNCRSRVESLLQQAQQSIVMYEQYIDDPHIQSILVKKHAEGVNMRIILGASETGNSAATTQFLKTLSSSVKFQPKPYVHAKVILIDNQFLLIGSMNISATSLDKNREIGILLLDPKQIRTVLYPFEKDRAKSN
ncbi:MAG: phospholipase D-like domain-containing protein [bacterium]